MKFKLSRPMTITIASVAILALVFIYIGVQMHNKKPRNSHLISNKSAAELRLEKAPTVVVIKAHAGEHKALVKGYGEAQAHYSITYTSDVSGRVEKLMARFESGQMVKKGETLAILEDTSYRQAVAEAKSDLAQAKLDLLEEQRTGQQARLEWKRSGIKGEPNSLLVLREPQLAAQKAVVENAQYTLKKAQQDLNKTVIKAPFDALIVDQNIQPGSYVQSGTSIAKLYSTDRVEIEIPLSTQQWKNLPQLSNDDLALPNAEKWSVVLYSTDGNSTWQGYVNRIELNVDTTSRQRSLVVAVDHPFDKAVGLLPGTFVQAQIEGAMLDNTLKLPASTISQKGEIWFLTNKNELQKATANKVFEKGDFVYVTAVAGLTDVSIIKRPLSNYLPGMLVIPKVEG